MVDIWAKEYPCVIIQFQSVNPAIQKTYDNEEWVMQAMEAQGFEKDSDDVYQIPRSGISMRIPAALIPKCPDDGSDVTMNLRADDSFVEDEGWHKASAAYADFIHRHENLRTLYLEIGVGANTPVIIKYPFWAMTATNPKNQYIKGAYKHTKYRALVQSCDCLIV